MNIFNRKKVQKNSEQEFSFFDLPSAEQKQLLVEAARRANQDQMEVIKRYGPMVDEGVSR